MFDPASTLEDVGATCTIVVQLILAISEFVDTVRDAPKEVQALGNQLAAQYAALGQLKVAIAGPRVSEVPEAWVTEFGKVLADTDDTIETLKGIIEKSKKTSVTGKAGQVVTSIKFSFESKQVRNLRARLHFQTSLIANLCTALNE